MISKENLKVNANELKFDIDMFVQDFVSYIYHWEEWVEWWWIWSDVGWTISLWDMFLSLEDVFLLCDFEPDVIHDMYREWTDLENKNITLRNFVKYWKHWKTYTKEELEESAKNLKETEKEFKNLIKKEVKSVEEELVENGIMPTIFIKSLHTWNILHSRRPWDFVAEYDDNKEVSTFIDQSLYYTRLWWTEWVDYEFVIKPMKERIKLLCDDWNYRFIADMNDKEIAFQLSKDYCDTLKDILRW